MGKIKEIKEIEKAKSQFFANLSHEIKTPINIIYSCFQLLEISKSQGENALWKAYCKYDGTIKQNCFRLLRLVNNILDVSSIDMGNCNINLENCNIVYLIEDIVTSVANYLEGKDVDITFDTDIEEIIIACDREKIEKIVLNLISNAIKYTKNNNQSIGKINIHISLEKNEVKISIKDNVIGIPK